MPTHLQNWCSERLSEGEKSQVKRPMRSHIIESTNGKDLKGIDEILMF